MHAYTPILLLSLSIISLPTSSRLLDDYSSVQLQSPAYSQLLAAKTQEDGPLRPRPGRKEPKRFNSHHWEI